MSYINYIPPVDTAPYATYAGCYRVSPPPTSTTPDMTFSTSPNCPVKLCKPCAGYNCKCNMDHMRAPQIHRYFVYKANMY